MSDGRILINDNANLNDNYFNRTQRHKGTKSLQKPVENHFSVKHPCCLPVWSGDVHHHSANEFAPAAAHLPTALSGQSLQKSKIH